MVVTACGGTPTPQVVKETVVVQGTPQVVEKEVTKVVEKVVTATPEPAPAVEQKLRIALSQLPVNIDMTRSSSFDMIIESLIYDPLVRIGADGSPEPSSAVSWEPIDPTTWQFKLREGVKFHNGEKFDAEAVKFSLDWYLNPDVRIVYSRNLRAIKEVQVVDKYTVNIITNGPSATLVGNLAAAWMRPPKYSAEVGLDGFAKAPIGSGPFKLVEFKPDERLILERNEEYWGGAPLLETVEFVEMPEQSTRAAALEAGEVDIAADMPIDQVQRLQDAGLEIESVTESVVICVLLVNPKQREEYPFLSDKRVRQALNYAVDKEELVNALTGGYGRPAMGQYVGPDGFGYDPDFIAYEYDPDKARELLAEAGYPDGFKFTLHYPVGRYAFADEIFQALPSYLAQVGVEVELDRMENAAWEERYLANELGTTVVAPNYIPTMDVDRILTFYHPSFPRKWVEEDPKMTALIDKERSTLDPVERLKVLHEAIAYGAEMAPVIWLMFPPSVYGYSPRVHDVGFRSTKQFDLNTAYIE
ncbi:MAG: ABC transporter substrate-binding protein, partial [Anaerolineae bacterium]